MNRIIVVSLQSGSFRIKLTPGGAGDSITEKTMKKIVNLITFLALAAMGLVGCQEKEQAAGENTLEVTPDKITFASKNNEDVIIKVTTDAPDWDYSADGWINAVKDGDNLIVNVPNNMEYDKRTGKILFTAGTARSVRVDITQEARIVSSLELSQETVEADPAGGQFEITVTSAEEWRVQGQSDWCTLSPLEGVTGDKIHVDVSANDGEEMRSAVFNVISGTVTKQITVISNPEPFIELVSPETGEQSLDYNGGDFTVLLRTNLSSENISSQLEGGDGWISAEAGSGAGKNVAYKIHVTANNTYLSRQASMTFSAEGVESVTVTISQSKRNVLRVLEPSSGACELSTDAATIQVIISTNLYPELYVSSPSWINIAGDPELVDESADGLSQYKYTFNVSEASGSRTGSIVFKYEQFEASVKVTQTSGDAVTAVIPDEAFRQYLYSNGYIISADNETVELTADGLSATSFDFSYNTKIRSLEGIGAFAELTSLNLSNCNVITVVDISSLKKVKVLIMGNCGYTEQIVLGDNPVTSLSYGWYTSVYAQKVTISGSKLESLDVSDLYNSYDDWTELDVTGCPALRSINSQRRTALTIYVTEAQKLQISNTGNGVLTVR